METYLSCHCGQSLRNTLGLSLPFYMPASHLAVDQTTPQAKALLLPPAKYPAAGAKGQGVRSLGFRLPSFLAFLPFFGAKVKGEASSMEFGDLELFGAWVVSAARVAA